MYLAIDIGGTKTLVATLDDAGVILEKTKIPTAKEYEEFKANLADVVAKLTIQNLKACGVAAPGMIDREQGIVKATGNLPWRNVPLRTDVEQLAKCPVVLDNDAKLGALSEAMLVKDQYNKVLYITLGTGIGVGIIMDRQIEPALADAEGGKMPLEHDGKMVAWEDFASGRAIKEHFGKQAGELTDPKDWEWIARHVAIGLIDLLAVVQPEVVIFGGGVDVYFDRLLGPLQAELKKLETPLIPIPVIIAAQRPEEAVVYGCYDLAKKLYGSAAQ